VGHAVCNKEVVLQFEGDPTVCITQPTDIAACVAATKLSAKEPHNGKGEVAGIAGGLAKPPPPPWPAGEEKHPVVQRMAGAGPWSWQGVTPISFLRGGQLVVCNCPPSAYDRPREAGQRSVQWDASPLRCEWRLVADELLGVTRESFPPDGIAPKREDGYRTVQARCYGNSGE
jgi:hypothetical protein